MRFFALLLLLPFSVNAAFTEFYVQTTGNNLNSGSTTNNAPHYFGTGGFWTNATGVWRKDAQTFTNVVVGDWASVYPDATTVNPVFIGLVTNVTTTNIWISLVAKAGTSPADDTSGATTIRVGGAWAGPNTNQNPSCVHPFGFVTSTMTNAAQNAAPIVWFKSGVYSTTNAMTSSQVGPIVWSGYGTVPGDGGLATFSGSYSGNSFNVLASTAVNNTYANFFFTENGASGTSEGATFHLTTENNFHRCSFTGMRGPGLRTGASGVVSECEVYACNESNNSGVGAFQSSGGGAQFVRCIAHDNTSGANCDGFSITDQVFLRNCISDSNTGLGFRVTSTTFASLLSCDAYNNTRSGIDLTAASAALVYIENCNFIKNGAYGIDSSGSSIRTGSILNCGFGSGTSTNASGSFGPKITGALNAFDIVGTVTYAADVTPWTDPVNGDFRINLTAAKSAGRGLFTQYTVNSPTNTVSLPDIGAAQSASTNAATSGGSYTFAQ